MIFVKRGSGKKEKIQGWGLWSGVGGGEEWGRVAIFRQSVFKLFLFLLEVFALRRYIFTMTL